MPYNKEQQHRHYVTHISKPRVRAKRNAYHTLKRRQRREFAILQYGGKCTCCGEERYEFLAFDHVNNDGAEHRKTVKGGEKMVSWLFKEGFPDHIQILCHNCNSAKAYYGICPHERERRGIDPY